MKEKRNYLMLVLKGIGMGAADVIPGVSGGTIAFITGIYEELIGSIRSFDLTALRQLLRLDLRRLGGRHLHLHFLPRAQFQAGLSRSGAVYAHASLLDQLQDARTRQLGSPRQELVQSRSRVLRFNLLAYPLHVLPLPVASTAPGRRTNT